FAQVLASYPCSVLEAPLALIHKHDDSLRHQLVPTNARGLRLVEEEFSRKRLPAQGHILRRPYTVQRSLSPVRCAWLVDEPELAQKWFSHALRADWRVLFKGSYSRKALRLWIRG